MPQTNPNRMIKCPPGSPDVAVGSSNYVGVAGSINMSASLETDRIRGPIIPNRSRTVGDILDGTSNTLAIGERTYLQDRWGSIWAGTSTVATTGVNGPNSAITIQECRGGINLPASATRNSFSSLHSGGANFALCDGSVRFVREGLSSKARRLPVRRATPWGSSA